MQPTSDRLVIVASSLAAGAVFFTGVVIARAQQPSAKVPLAPEKYKNIQVFQDVPADQILATMDYFEAALGSPCATCHQPPSKPGEPPAFDVDTPAKNRARDMIRMVKALNAGNYGVKISCGTCHAGQRRPPGVQLMTPERVAANAGARAGGPGSGSQPATPPMPVDDVLDKYFAAIGGRGALDAMPAVVVSAAQSRLGASQSVPFTLEWHGDKFLLTAALNGLSASVGFDGERGWTMGAGRVQEITPDLQLYKLRRLGRPLLSTHVREEMTQLTAEPPQGLRDLAPGSSPTAVNVISGSTWPGVLDRLYFDAATGLLLRRTVMTSGAFGMTLEERYDYSDYRPEEGVQVPHAITHTTAFSIDVLTISGVTRSSATDDSRFSKPRGLAGEH